VSRLQTVLVTGGAGYVGSALLPELVEEGRDVRILDSFAGSSPRNLVGAPDYEFVRGDVRDNATLRRAIDGVDAVIHLAGITGAARSHEIREEVLDVNARGTEAVVAAAVEDDIDRIVLASSCNVYGNAFAEDLDEESEPRPANPYAESKLEAEEAVTEAPIESVTLRMATNFGWSPGVRFNLVVNDFVFRALNDEPLTVYGDGTNWRPFVHVRDAAGAFSDALEWDPGCYNVGLENVRIQTIAETVEHSLDRSVEVDYLRDRDPGPSYHVDFSAARSQGYEAEYGLAEGISELADRLANGRKVSGRV